MKASAVGVRNDRLTYRGGSPKLVALLGRIARRVRRYYESKGGQLVRHKRRCFLGGGGRGPSLMARCVGIKRDGGRCTAVVNGSQTSYCYQHDPKRAEERRRNASRAARSKPNRELVGIKARLSDLADDVLAENVDKGVAAVASQVLNVYLRAVSVELKVREQEELEGRLEEVEEILRQRKDERWQA